jgi:isopentenyl phosphate kinase
LDLVVVFGGGDFGHGAGETQGAGDVLDLPARRPKARD